MLRSLIEIKTKINELEASSDNLIKRIERTTNFITVVFFIVLSFGVLIMVKYEWKENPTDIISALRAICASALIIVSIIMLTYHFKIKPNWAFTSERRRLLAKHLEEAAHIIEKDGEEAIYQELDKMIVDKAKNKKNTILNIFKMPKRKREEQILLNVRLEAFSWIATPG